MPERVWEPYLTEQDKAHLAMKAPQEVGFGKRPALLLVDLYRWVFGMNPNPCWTPSRTGPAAVAWRLGTPFPTSRPCWTLAAGRAFRWCTSLA